MAELWRQLGQRHQCESPLGQAGVWDDQLRLVDYFLVVKQDINVDQAWTVKKSGLPSQG